MSAAAGLGARQAAEALLRGVGGRMVLLRIPQPAVAGDAGEQLGLATAEFEDVGLGPVVFRKVRPQMGTQFGEKVTDSVTYELLVSADAVERLTGSLEYSAASVLFAQAAGVVVDGVLLRIGAAVKAESGGTAYLYRLLLHGAAVDRV